MSTATMRTAWKHTACQGPIIKRYFIGKKTVNIAAETNEATQALACVILAHRYPVLEIGGYHCRPVTGGKGLSLHGHAIAIDVNPTKNPYSKTLKDAQGRVIRLAKLVTDMPPAMIADITSIRTRGGKQVWRWGGDWDGHPETREQVYDAMHFEIACTPAELAQGIDWKTVRLPARDTNDPSTWPSLQVGDRGPTVFQLQEFLGFDNPDGKFGTNTKNRVAKFQREHKLFPDSVVGHATWTVILKGLAEAPPELQGPAEEPQELEKVIVEGAGPPVDYEVAESAGDIAAAVEEEPAGDDDAGPETTIVNDPLPEVPVDVTPVDPGIPKISARKPLSGLAGVKDQQKAVETAAAAGATVGATAATAAPKVIEVTKEVPVPQMPGKAPQASDTIKMNGVVLLVMAGAKLTGYKPIMDFVDSYPEQIIIAVNAVNIFLRSRTNAPLDWRKILKR